MASMGMPEFFCTLSGDEIDQSTFGTFCPDSRDEQGLRREFTPTDSDIPSPSSWSAKVPRCPQFAIYSATALSPSRTGTYGE